MPSSTVTRGVSVFALGLSLLVGCDSQMNGRTGDSRSGDSRVAADRSGTIGTTPNPAATSPGTTAAKADDAAITAQIKAKLQDQAAAGLSNVDVESTDGVVKLTGVVPRADLKQRAAELAKNVDGVRDVVNAIEVRAA